MMRWRLVCMFLIVCCTAVFAQELKKKMLGAYAGTIPAYALDFQGQIVQVPVVEIRVELAAANTVIVSLNGKSKQGTYRILEEDKTGVTLECMFPDELIPEMLVLYKKEKRLERKGVYPQPDVFMVRST